MVWNAWVARSRSVSKLQLVVVLLHLFDDAAVAARVGDHGHALEVLGGGADHGRPADIDVLDDLFLGDAAAAGDFLEGIEADDHHVDGLDVVLLEREHVLVDVAVGQQAGVDVGMQRLHAPVEDLGEAGDVADAGHGDALFLEEFGGAAGGDDLDTEVAERLGELVQPDLVGD